MIDARTLSAALTMALLGCSTGAPPPDGPNDAAEVPAEPPPPAADATPPAGDAPSETATAPAEPKLPMDRPEPLPPADGKPVAKEKSARNGAAACCGEGTCGPCKPLPAKRAEPMPPKDGKVMAPSKSVRKGKEACCGEGTCGAC